MGLTSPYIQRFDEIFLRILESGIYSCWNQEDDRSFKQEFRKPNVVDNKVFVNNIVIILCSGFVVSITVFLFEILGQKLLKYLNSPINFDHNF